MHEQSEELNSLPGLISRTARIQRMSAAHCTVHIVHFRSDEFDCSAFERAAIRLPGSVATSANRRKATFFFGRLAASEALSRYGFEHCDIAIGDVREPVFPRGIVGSITHTDVLAGAVALPSPPWKGVGVDIESPIRADLLDHVEDVVLSKEENEVLAACSTYPRSVRTALVFSAKESFYKALSKASGRFLEFDVLELTAIDACSHRMHFVTRDALSSEWPLGTTCSIDYSLLPDGHVLTVFGW